MYEKYIKIRIPFGTLSAIGPGKADLLEAIERRGSISAAARDMGMSYKRAWDLVDTMNHAFREPLVVTATGGSHGGGAQISSFGLDILHRYRDMQVKARTAITADLDSFLGTIIQPPLD